MNLLIKGVRLRAARVGFPASWPRQIKSVQQLYALTRLKSSGVTSNIYVHYP